VKTMERPLRVREVLLADGTTAFSSDGAPSDCVALPLLGLIEDQIDLVVSESIPMQISDMMSPIPGPSLPRWKL